MKLYLSSYKFRLNETSLEKCIKFTERILEKNDWNPKDIHYLIHCHKEPLEGNGLLPLMKIRYEIKATNSFVFSLSDLEYTSFYYAIQYVQSLFQTEDTSRAILYLTDSSFSSVNNAINQSEIILLSSERGNYEIITFQQVYFNNGKRKNRRYKIIELIESYLLNHTDYTGSNKILMVYSFKNGQNYLDIRNTKYIYNPLRLNLSNKNSFLSLKKLNQDLFLKKNDLIYWVFVSQEINCFSFIQLKKSAI